MNLGTPYNPKWLRTHAAIIGMTGSGKTGLGVVTMEEAANLGIPAIIIDPKGDLTNLTLQDNPKIGCTIYTPGLAKMPVSILGSLARSEIDRDRIASIATAVLGLAKINSDPLQREHILLASIIEQAWQSGHDLDMPSLINAIQSPPLDRMGALPLETVYPEKDRYKLAIKLNNFLASPSFHAWLEGFPLDIESFLWKDGAPQHAIFYLSHLSDHERMFFVTLLYTAIEGWMRTQEGTENLKALVYFDEVAGYLPPVREPPAKPVILRLLKQARAYGLGLILATQNPVDLDYKALSNIGTWMIGKLQTEQDKARLAEGLEMDIPTLEHRKFLLHSIYQDPVIFHVRDAYSELRGPMTPDEIEGNWEPKHKQTIKIIPAVPSRYDVYYHKGNGKYHGHIGGRARVTFASKKYDILIDKSISGIWNTGWEPFELVESERRDNDYAPLDIPDLTQTNFEDWIYRSQYITVLVNKTLGIAGTQVEFNKIAKEKCEGEKTEAYHKYKERLAKLKIRVEREKQRLNQYEQKVKIRKQEQSTAGFEVAVAIASGRRRSLTTPMTKQGMVKNAQSQVVQQKLKLNGLRDEWQLLNDNLLAEYDLLEKKWKDISGDVSEERIKPYKKDIVTELFGLIWIPKED